VYWEKSTPEEKYPKIW